MPSSVHEEALPILTTKSITYSGCCLALSRPLLDHLGTLLPPQPDLVLSIGSGFGLLEALLIAEPYNINVIGVEVEPSSNQYLPEANHRSVPGTRFLEPLASVATTWLFVYPRRTGLVQQYLTEYGKDNVRKIVWAGPQADWDDYKGCFTGGWDVTVRSADEVGGQPWELIAVASKCSG